MRLLIASKPAQASSSTPRMRLVLALALLVTRVLLANHPHNSSALDDFAILANLFDRSPYFHGLCSQSKLSSRRFGSKAPYQSPFGNPASPSLWTAP
jgi:hypothetical protein